jgi:hypothetical protein
MGHASINPVTPKRRHGFWRHVVSVIDSQLHLLKAAESLTLAEAEERWEEMDGIYRDDVTIAAAKDVSTYTT